jgi:hypothetical protein
LNTNSNYGLTVYNNDDNLTSNIRSTIFAQNLGTGLVWQGYGPTSETSRIGADGSATFAGQVKSTGPDENFYSNTTLGAGNSAFRSYSGAAGVSNSYHFYAGTSQGELVTIATDGSATFAGRVTQGNVSAAANSGLGGVILYEGSGGARIFRNHNNSTTPAEALGIYNNGADVTSINTDGSARFAGTITATVVPPSDVRFKENITPAKPQLADVVALGGILKNYDWNEDAPVNDELQAQRQLGLIAQEAEEVCPSIVKDIHRTKTVEVTPAVTGPKGRVLTEAVTQEVDDSYKGISQDALIMKLIGAVAELSAEVQSLKEGN